MSAYATAFCFTLNNYNDLEIQSLDENEFKYTYLLYGYEIAPKTGTPHLQGYMQFKFCKRRDTLSRINPRIRWAEAKGSDEDNWTYCTKGLKYKEFGTRVLKQQGKRNDLDKIKEDLFNGRELEEIMLDNPMLYHKYGRTMEKNSRSIYRRLIKNWLTSCKWLWGKTGVGKSRQAFENFNPLTHYVWRNDKGWQDDYNGEDTVIINDFRGEIAFQDLLQMIDRYNYYIRRRGKSPLLFSSKHIIITSSLHPKDVYLFLQNGDSIDQLLRRCEVTELI